MVPPPAAANTEQLQAMVGSSCWAAAGLQPLPTRTPLPPAGRPAASSRVGGAVVRLNAPPRLARSQQFPNEAPRKLSKRVCTHL